MDSNKKIETTETHNFFPSGQWEGFYTYQMGPSAPKHPMSFILKFSKNIVRGVGNDDLAAFNWKGTYDVEELICQMTKFYVGRSHSVFYNGLVDENGIWGQWRIHAFATGGFHIWPKGSKTASEMAAIEAAPLKESFPTEKVRIIDLK